MNALFVVGGLVIVAWVLAEAFEALVLPRRVTRPFRLTRLYYRAGWTAWRWLAGLLPASRRHHTFLSVFGPLSLLFLFAVWAALLILGFALVQHGLAPRGEGFVESVYLSGTTFTTLGYGDVTPDTRLSQATAIVEAALGFGYFAVVVGYLPVLYQSFSDREAFLALLDARAGSPPAAGRMLVRVPPGVGGGDATLNLFLADAERWAGRVLESHLSFPVLGHYRSQHDNQSWLAGLLCVLDASALLLTVADGADRHQARLTFAMARHCLVDLSLVLRWPPAPPPDRLPPDRLAALVADLRAAGVPARDDPAAVARLAELRGLYEPVAAALGGYFRLTAADVYPADGGPDNWQTSAWMRRADPLTALGADPRDGHFD